MDSKALSAVITQFSAKFCNELPKTESVVSSPLSAEVLLALLTLGSTDTAHTELLTSLGFPDDECIRSSFANLTTNLKSISGVTLDIANKIYIKQGSYELAPALKDDAVKVFDCGTEKMDFSNGGAAAQTINNWVESKTNKRIKDLFKSDDLNSDTRLVLVNALYFKGSWKKPFDPKNTIEKPFHIDSQKSVDVPMMYKKDKFKYGESAELKSQLLELMYEGDQASMLIVLPSEVEGLNAVLQKLADGFDLFAETDKMATIDVRVTIPKFKIETEIDLNILLPKLGIEAIFNPQNSGLTRILNNSEPLFVSKAIQKAFIEVNEEGAEAAAATGVAIMLRSMMIEMVFSANKPFLYVLRRTDGAPLFLGAYRGPPAF